VPEALRKVLRGAQRNGYKALFDASAKSIRDVASAKTHPIVQNTDTH
jgi:hypothetical protein